MPRFWSSVDDTLELHKALDAMYDFKGTESSSLLERAFSSVVCDDRLQSYIEQYKLKEAGNHDGCLCYFLGKPCYRNSNSCVRFGNSAMDHGSVWLRDGKPFVYISQPYNLALEGMRSVIKVCDEHNLVANIRNRSWLFPTDAVFIEIHHRK
jgi:hypothetical protein